MDKNNILYIAPYKTFLYRHFLYLVSEVEGLRENLFNLHVKDNENNYTCNGFGRK